MQAEAFGYFLQKNLPDFKVTIAMKQDAKEYEAFLRDTFAKHKWSDRLAADRSAKDMDQLPQVIYRPSGQLIGSTADFLAWVSVDLFVTGSRVSCEARLIVRLAMHLALTTWPSLLPRLPLRLLTH